MIEYQVNLQSADTSPEARVTSKKGRVRIDLPVNSFKTAFVNFNEEAQAFAVSLSDSLDRGYAYRYVGYLQDIAHGAEQPKQPHTNGRPNWRLIAVELERLFRCHFFRPEHLRSVPN